MHEKCTLVRILSLLCNTPTRKLILRLVTARRYGFVSRKTVLRIHDILVWIRIRVSMPLTNGSGFGSGCGSFYFHYQKKSQNSENQGFSHYFCLMIEGSETIPLTNGSGPGSRRPRNMWIRIRIRIRNTLNLRMTFVVLCRSGRYGAGGSQRYRCGRSRRGPRHTLLDQFTVLRVRRKSKYYIARRTKPNHFRCIFVDK